GPGATTDTLTDAPALEALLFRYHASLVVSGRLGWNGLYYATAPGLHEPCAGSNYPSAPPASSTSAPCSAATGAPSPSNAQAQLSVVLGSASTAAPPPPVD